MTEAMRKLAALMKLAAARQSPIDELAQQVYLEGLERVPSDIVERACQQLAMRPKNDYEPMFPSLGIVVEECKAVRDHDDSMNAPKQLKEARSADLTRAEAKAWVTKLKRDVESLRGKSALTDRAGTR